MKKGKLIVIDGTDGSGKATQTALLVGNLKKAGYRVVVENFPQYGKKSAGAVEDYLYGLYGTAKELGAYIPSIFYAVDRFAAAERTYIEISKKFHYPLIECYHDGKILTREEIANKIWQIMKLRLKV